MLSSSESVIINLQQHLSAQCQTVLRMDSCGMKLRTSVHAGVIGERWRDSLKSQQQSKISISQIKTQRGLGRAGKRKPPHTGIWERGGVHYFRFCPTAGRLAGWRWWVGGWTNIARLPNGLPWTRARPQCSCIHANLHHFIVVTLLEREVQSNKPKDVRCGSLLLSLEFMAWHLQWENGF